MDDGVFKMELIAAGQVVLKKLMEHQYEAYFVGGMVRDRLLKREIYDVDITTSAKPNEVISLFNKTIKTGIKHGTVTVMIEGIPIEVTTFRIESEYQDYRRPSEVSFSTSLIEDLKRRDFTMNAITESLEGTLYDPFNGFEDLKQEKIRAVGEAYERFKEDPLRMLRALRFVSKLGFKLEERTYEAILSAAHLIQYISKERVKKELEGLVNGDESQEGLRLLIETGLTQHIDYFSVLTIYQEYQWKQIETSLELFALVALANKELSPDYLLAWPFSREEKRKIKAIIDSFHYQWPLPYIQYRYGEEVAKSYYHLRGFIQQESVEFYPVSLPIENRKQLAIEISDLLQVINRPKGPWIQTAIERLEYEVVMQQLKNETSDLMQYVKNSNLGESYEYEN